MAKPVIAQPPDAPIASGAAGLLAPDLDLKPGDQIDRYNLLEKVGEGGFGVVYLAEQREPVRRQVALKIIKVGMDTREVVARFQAERQALALMDHPNIAKILDGGVVGFGQSPVSNPKSEISNQGLRHSIPKQSFHRPASSTSRKWGSAESPKPTRRTSVKPTLSNSTVKERASHIHKCRLLPSHSRTNPRNPRCRC